MIQPSYNPSRSLLRALAVTLIAAAAVSSTTLFGCAAAAPAAIPAAAAVVTDITVLTLRQFSFVGLDLAPSEVDRAKILINQLQTGAKTIDSLSLEEKKLLLKVVEADKKRRKSRRD